MTAHGNREEMPKSPTGFTLIELIVALQLFILLLLFIGTLIPFSQISARSSSHQDIAMTYAASMIDRIRSLPWQSITKGVMFNGITGLPPISSSSYPPYPYPRITIEGKYPDPGTLKIVEHRTIYYFVVKAVYEPDPPVVTPDTRNLIKVTVDVYWNEYGMGERQSGGTGEPEPGNKITLSTKIVRKQQ